MSLELAPGVLIARRYRLEHTLGQGGMGIVWAAVNTLTQKRVALKFLKGPVGIRPELRRRFLREARAASAVGHPNVLEVHDVFELDDDTPVMLMDLLEGETLGQRIAREGALSVTEAADIMVQVVSAVGTAHAVGVIHRDLKPDNVFLLGSADGIPSVRVLDFGIAKLMGSEGDAVETAIITSTGSTLGTPCYMSPEQSFGEKDIDYRTDIWSLGCILYECLTGVRPVEGDSLGQVVKRLLSEGIRPITELAPSLPRDLAELVEQMLGRERERRPRDLREVQEVLKRFATATAPDFRAPISEQTATSSDVSRSAETVSGPKDVTPPTSNTLVLDTVRSAEPTPVQVQGPETGGAQTVPWGGVMRRRVGVPWVVGAVLLALGLPILAMRSGSRGTTVPSSAAPRASTAAPSEFGSAAVRAAEQAPKEPIPTPSASATPAPEATRATVASMPQPKQDVRTAKPAPRPTLAATSVPPPAPSASVAPPVPRPRVGGLAEKPPF